MGYKYSCTTSTSHQGIKFHHIVQVNEHCTKWWLHTMTWWLICVSLSSIFYHSGILGSCLLVAETAIRHRRFCSVRCPLQMITMVQEKDARLSFWIGHLSIMIVIKRLGIAEKSFMHLFPNPMKNDSLGVSVSGRTWHSLEKTWFSVSALTGITVSVVGLPVPDFLINVSHNFSDTCSLSPPV